MKKLFLLVFIVLLSFNLISCVKETKYIELLPDEIKNEIKLVAATKYERNTENIEIEYFFGGFDNSYIIILNTPVNEYLVDYTENVGEYDFRYLRHYNLCNSMVVYNNNNLYTLQEAVDNKLLTLDNIKKVKENFDNIFDKYNEEYFEINKELENDGLTVDIYNKLRDVIPYHRVLRYLGEYNEAYVAYYLEYTPQATTGYLEFLDLYLYPKSKFNCIRVIYQGKDYNQKEAYEMGILNNEDLTNIYTKYFGYSPNEISIKDNEITLLTVRNILKQYYEEVIVNKYENIKWDINIFLESTDIYSSNNIYDDMIYLPLYVEDNQVKYEEELGGYTFELYEGIEYIIYKNGKVYNMKDAYFNGILNEETIKKIYKDWFEK